MKRLLYIILFTVIIVNTGMAEGLRAYFSYATFNMPGEKAYIETYLSVDGNSVQYVKDTHNKWYGSLEIDVIFSIGDSIVNFNKYSLKSPELADTSLSPLNFLDVQRYSMKPGVYNMKLKIKDINSKEPPFESQTQVTLGFPANKMSISDIELVADFKKDTARTILTKNGYSILPYVFNYYPESVRKLSFYAEVYGADSVVGKDAYMITTYIRPYELDKKLDNYFQLKRMKSAAVSPVLKTFNISDLPSGNYLLVIEAHDRNNVLLASKELFFQRYNPDVEFNLTTLLAQNPENSFVGRISNRDTLVKYIKFTFPISTDFERRYAESQIVIADIGVLQKYFLNFWITRDKENPEQAWIDYKHLVDYANRKFTAGKIPGYRTDRGRVFLQYGQPNVVAESYHEPAAYPYEIWHYYELEGQHDKKFVFYSRDNVTNDFQLIHSDAVGELHNYQWQYIVYKRVMYPANLVDPISQPNAWGNQSSDYYYQPR